jgi:hypothetical protein
MPKGLNVDFVLHVIIKRDTTLRIRHLPRLIFICSVTRSLDPQPTSGVDLREGTCTSVVTRTAHRRRE